MSDTKARRVLPVMNYNDPNGTHHLAPVDRYVVMDREKMLDFLGRIARRGREALELEITLLAQELLAEIGGDDE